HLIALQTNPRTSYEIYFDIQDRIIRGYTELRNELSLRKFGQPFASLNNEQKEAVRQFYPQRISEIEITQKGGEE
ncbi:MAG: biopolymer transporter ExbD, partial [Bacteroidaceae bacterium]|nr:biopolymer transporter ExbD [Bacteroidaceae bacterium]